jgi:hypothetical protein
MEITMGKDSKETSTSTRSSTDQEDLIRSMRWSGADETNGMGQHSAATLCANDAAGGGADRRRLSVRHQHPPGRRDRLR